MSYFPQIQNAYELTAGKYQLTVGPGYIGKISIHLKGTGDKNSKDVWRVSDAGAGIPPGDTPGHIIWATFIDDPKAMSGSVIDLGWSVNEGIFLEVPAGGVCSVNFIGAKPPTVG